MATFHENLVQSFHNFRDKYLKANGKYFKFGYDSTKQKYGYTIDNEFNEFSKDADATLSTTSTNSVQNKVVTKEINEINSNLGAKSALPYPTFPFANNIAQVLANLESFKETKNINNKNELTETMFFSTGSIVPLNNDFSMQRYAKGLFINYGDGLNTDAVLIAVSYDKDLYIAYRNGSNWEQAYILNLTESSYTFSPSTYGNLYGNAKMMKYGNVIQLEIHGFKTLSGNYENIIFPDGSIPSAYRPSSVVVFTREDPTGYKYRFEIKPSGALTAYVYGTPSTAEQNNFLDFMTYII